MAQLRDNGPTGGYSVVLKIACYGAAAALCAVTVAANLKFGLTLGSTPEEKAIYATASVAADIIKCTMVMVVIRLWQKRQRMLACVGTVFGLVCLTWSLASAAGFALATREHTAAMHAATSKTIDGWTTTIRRAGEQLALVERSRPPAVIEAELAGQLVPAAIWKRTQACTELTLPESHTACARVLALRQELAAAQSARALEERVDEARRHLATAPVVGLTADPQVAGLAALLGTEEPTLRRALALLLAVLVEAGSAFGFALASAATANPPPPPPTGAPSRTTAVPGRAPNGSAPSGVVSFAERAARRKRGRRPATQPDASLVGWAAQCLRRDHHGCIGARATYQVILPVGGGCGRQRRYRDQVRPLHDRQHRSHGRQEDRARQGAFYVGVELIWGPDQPAVRMAA